MDGTKDSPGGFGRRFAKSAGWMFLRLGGRQLISSAGFFVFALILDPETFGVAAMATSLGFLGRLILERGVMDAVIQREDEDARALSTAFWLAMVLSAAVWGVCAAIAVALAWGQPAIGSAWPLIVASSAAPLTAFSRVHEGLARRRFQFRDLALIQFVASFVAVLIGLALAMLGAGAWAIIAFVLVEIAAFSIALVASVPWRPGMVFDRGLAWRQCRFSGAVIVGSIFTIGALRIVEIVVGAILGPVMAGHFRLGVQANRLLTQLLRAPVNQVVLPSFARIRDEGELQARTIQVLAASAFVCFPAYLVAAALSPAAFELILGPEWLPAGEAAHWLLLGLFGGFLMPILNPLFLARGRVAEATMQASLFFCLTIAGSSIGAWLGGLDGAVKGYAFTTLAMAPYSFWRMQDATGVNALTMLRSIAPHVLAACLAYATAAAVMGSSIIPRPSLLAEAVASGGLTYVIASPLLALAIDFRRTMQHLRNARRLFRARIA